MGRSDGREPAVLPPSASLCPLGRCATRDAQLKLLPLWNDADGRQRSTNVLCASSYGR